MKQEIILKSPQKYSQICIFNFQKLDNLLAKGKKILQLTEICGKYETEREKVQPFKPYHTVENAKQAEDHNNENEILKDFKDVCSLSIYFH